MEDDRFYVKSLTLENFRCFEKTELGPFDPHFNLIIGENGTGKSSVLVALANMYRRFAETELDDTRRALIRLSDIRTSPLTKTTRTRFSPSSLTTELNWRGAIYRDSERTDLVGELGTAVAMPPFDNPFAGQFSHPAKGASAPLLAFYSTLRNVEPARLSEKELEQLEFRRPGAFKDWSGAKTNSDISRAWWRDQTLLALQGTAPGSERLPAFQLSLLKEAAREALPELLDIEYNGGDKDIVFSLADGRREALSQTSDGRKALVGLIADLTRRACMLNADIFVAETLRQTPGLVLIDEIDLHLHPKWQRQIVGALKRIFPKIQFFATTHSPQVIGEARPEEVVLLTNDSQQQRPMGSYGTDIGEAPDLVGAEAYLWRIEHGIDEAAE